MTVYEMREAIARVYANPGWKKKVEKMPDYQVTAVYLKFEEQGKLWKKPIPQWKQKQDMVSTIMYVFKPIESKT